MKKINIQWVAESAIIAALYAALTWLLAPISYGSIQFRISEVLVLLVVFKPSYAFALILGCFISNTTSSLGWWDMVFGTLATTLAVLPMMKIKKLSIACLLPVVSNSIIIAIELYLALGIKPIWLSMITVALGEAVVLYLIGIPVMLSISKNSGLVELLHLNVEKVKAPKGMTFMHALAIAISILGIILFIAYPFYDIYVDSYSYYTALMIAKENIWAILFPIAIILYFVSFLLVKKKTKPILCIISASLLWIPYILIGIEYKEALDCPYYYGYSLYIFILYIFSIIGYRKDRKNEA